MARGMTPAGRMELRHLRYFVAVAEERGFGRASKRLRVAQQALSRQVADLEREVGATLLVRAHAGAHPTPAGVRFLDGARCVLAAAERAAEQARRTAEDGASVRVGAPDVGAAAMVLRDAVASFRARGPETSVVYDLAPPLEQQDRLRAGALDVGFESVVRMAERFVDDDSERDPEFCRARIATDALSAVMLPVSHAVARGTRAGSGDEDGSSIECTQLSGLPLLVARGTSPDDTDAMIEELGRRGWRGHVESAAGTVVSLAALVAAGAGWLIAPRAAHGWTLPGTVQRQLVGGPVGWLDTCAIWRDDDGEHATGEFIMVLRAHVRSTDWRVARPHALDTSTLAATPRPPTHRRLPPTDR